MSRPGTVTDTMVEEAYATMARIIRDHGEKYLPIFKRLHEEKQLRQAASDLKNIALQVATEVIR